MEEDLHGNICGASTFYGKVEATASRTHISGMTLCFSNDLMGLLNKHSRWKICNPDVGVNSS